MENPTRKHLLSHAHNRNLREGAIPVAVQGIAVGLKRETLIGGSYPLTRGTYIYLNRRKEKTVDAKSDEFLRFALSPEGQALVTHHGPYLPLSAATRTIQLRKLE